ncbi:MAG TPA: sugar phosphate isomerase/epimerase family protein [Verrucomicrobiae bacterium]|jgi:sugar phosphate isomerase/epimerase|nr:sugar phosphate isomerase/epimerase family protein [Verrucomicrobiae bacterium]
MQNPTTSRSIQFAICNEIFKEWPLAETFAFVVKTGYDAIEIAPFTIAKYVTEIPQSRRAEIKALAERNNLAISGVHWVLVQAEGMHLTHPDAAVRQRTSVYFSDLVNFCADLGGKTIVVGSPKQRSLEPGVSFEQGWEWATAVFREPVMRAEQRGVTICFEPLAPSETNFINTARQAIEFVGQLHTPHFKIILDVKAMCSEARPIPEIIRESWPNFAYFHANDKNLKGPGFGEVDFRPIAGALKEVGYKGYVSVEVFDFTEGPERIATGSLENLKRAFGESQ